MIKLYHRKLVSWITLFTCISMFNLYAIDDIDIGLLQEAWTISGGGSNGRPYYSLDIDGVHLEGERPWEERWKFIQGAMDYQGKRILELGCNITLTSIYLIKYCNAYEAVGVDRPYKELAEFGTPMLIESAKMTQLAFGINVPILQTDINNSPYEKLIGYNYDVVICMSFLKWVYDKERLLDYLSQFNHIIFEGHEADQIEITRFQNYGFQYRVLGKTQIGASYSADAYRTLIYFFKEEF